MKWHEAIGYRLARIVKGWILLTHSRWLPHTPYMLDDTIKKFIRSIYFRET